MPVIEKISSDEELIEAIQGIVEAIRKNALDYAIASGIKGRALQRSGDFGVRIDEYGYPEIWVEYNDACNCHPEYQTFSQQLDWQTALKMWRGEDWKTPIQQATIARKEREVRAAQERAQAEARRQAAEKEKRERAQLAELKAKYGE